MPLPHSKILDLLGDDPVGTENARAYAENAENAVSPLPTPITAFRSFTASTRAREHVHAGAVSDEVVDHLTRQEITTVTAQGNQEITTITAATITCFSCWGSDFWQGSGVTVCRRCHPPAPGAEAPTSSRTHSDALRPVEIDAGSTAGTTPARTSGVRGDAA